MGDSVTALLQQAQKLSEADRAALAGLLIESLDPHADEAVNAAWAETVERRVRELETGATTTVSWDALKDRLIERGRRRAAG